MERKLHSKRDISVNLYLLENGNGLLESVMLDPGHLIHLNLEINPKTREIVDANSRMVDGPYALCSAVEDKAKGLIGLKVERGIMKKVGHAVGGSEGCVHLRELAIDTINFAGTALVGIEAGFGMMDASFNRKDPETRHKHTEELLKNSCKSYSHPYTEHEAELKRHNSQNKQQ